MEKTFKYALNLFLFLSPLFLFRDYQTSFARGLFFIIGTFVLFGISLGVQQKRIFSNMWLLAIFFLALIQVFFNESSGAGEWYNFWLSMGGFIYVFCGFLLFRTVFCYVDKIRNFIWPIILICFINLFLSICQINGYDFLWARPSFWNNISGVFELPQQSAQYSAMTIAILFFVNPLLMFIPLATLFLAKEVTPILSLICSGILFSIYFNNKVGIISLLIVALILGIGFRGHISEKWAGNIRPRMWEATLKKATEKPFLGWGYRSFNREVLGQEDKLGSKQGPNAFSDWFHTAQELGFPILLAISLFFVNLFKRINRLPIKSPLTLCLAFSVLTVLLNMFGQCLIRHASVSGTFIILLAFLFIKLEEGEIKWLQPK